jgi:hypothetical protein
MTASRWRLLLLLSSWPCLSYPWFRFLGWPGS